MQDENQIWTYIPAAEFKVPAPPVVEVARGGVLRLCKSLQNVIHRKKKKLSDEEPQWDRPSAARVISVAPDADWKQAADSLVAALGEDWFESERPARPLRPIIGPPGCDVASALQLLAQQRGLNVAQAPAPEAILAASPANEPVLPTVDESSKQILVIPQLEHWFLRHQDGLTVMRCLIERLTTGQQRVLVGCDSWAWTFLQRAIGIEELLGEPQTLAPFDVARLDAWFRATFDLQRHEYWQSGEDETVFPELPPAEATNAEEPRHANSTLLRSLAARARGNPAVALALWRASLRTHDTVNNSSAPDVDARKHVLWIVPPAEQDLSEFPIDVERDDRFVLHAVLLHGGLSLTTLLKILPGSSEQMQRRVSVLRRAGILEERQGRWSVTMTAYPHVRHELSSEGFLIDAF